MDVSFSTNRALKKGYYKIKIDVVDVKISNHTAYVLIENHINKSTVQILLQVVQRISNTIHIDLRRECSIGLFIIKIRGFKSS